MTTYATETEALIAARKVWGGADVDLIYQCDKTGVWGFDHGEIISLRNLASDKEPDMTDIVETENPEVTPDAPETPAVPLTKREAQRVAREAKAADKAKAKAERSEAARVAREAKEAEAKRVRDTKAAERDAKRAEAQAQREAAAADRLKKREDRRAAARQRQVDAAARAEELGQRRKLAGERMEAARLERERLSREAEALRAANSRNGVHKPNPGTKLATLWTLIDGLIEATGELPAFAFYKELALGMPYAEVGSPGTITTAYYDYRVYHGYGKTKSVAAAESAE